MMAPLKVLHYYIVVHEMDRHIHPTHAEAFWAEIHNGLPEYLELKKRLKVNWARTNLGR